MAYIFGLTVCLVSTYVPCETLSTMQQEARLPQFLVQNSLSAHTQVFQKCWSRVPPPSQILKFCQDLALGIWVGLEYPHPSPYDLCGSWGLETNRCIPQGYRLVSYVEGKKGPFLLCSFCCKNMPTHTLCILILISPLIFVVLDEYSTGRNSGCLVIDVAATKYCTTVLCGNSIEQSPCDLRLEI